MKFTKEHAQTLVENYEVDSALECEGDEIREHNPTLVEAMEALVEFSKSSDEPEFCPHAHPHAYCAECPVDPCPVGLKKSGNAISS